MPPGSDTGEEPHERARLSGLGDASDCFMVRGRVLVSITAVLFLTSISGSRMGAGPPR